MSSPSTPIFGDKKHWLLVVEDITKYAWSFFLKEKSDLSGVLMSLVKNLNIKYNTQVQYLCCDNAGENDAFEKACKQEGMGMEFEFTAHGTPQQNG